jgi:hypothetical protein
MHDPGGLRMIALPSGVTGTALFGGPQDCYRYQLDRVWNTDGLACLFIMMNPSTADPKFDDPTIAKVTRMVRRWSWRGVPNAFGRLMIGNTFAYRVSDPVGPDNDLALQQMALMANLVCFAYGKPKVVSLRGRGLWVSQMLRSIGVQPHVLRLSADGTPWHPLYLPDATVPFPWMVG